MTQFYAYVHARPDTVTAAGIFYVGKGTAFRSHNLLQTRRNKHHQNIVRKYGAKNILLGQIECSSEASAFELERGLIKCLRRMGVSLANQTDGGEGSHGATTSEATKRKISDSVRVTWADPNLRAKQSATLKLVLSTPEQKDRNARIHGGRKRSGETKARMSASMTAHMADPTARALVSEAMTKRMSNSEQKLAASTRMKQRMEDPANRERISLAVKAHWAKLRAIDPAARRLRTVNPQPVLEDAARKDGAPTIDRRDIRIF